MTGAGPLRGDQASLLVEAKRGVATPLRRAISPMVNTPGMAKEYVVSHLTSS